MTYSLIVKRAIQALFSFILFLFFLEGCLRVGGYLLSKKEDIADPAHKNFNIICLGDSFTYGIGVESAYAYPAQLEKMLNAACPGKSFKVFNLGVPGFNSSQHLKYLKSILGKYKNIDLVIVLTGANDNWNFTDSNIYELAAKNNLKIDYAAARFETVLLKTRLYKMLKIALLNLQKTSPEVDFFNREQKKGDFDARIFTVLLEYNLKGMAELARANNAAIIFQDYPHARDGRLRYLSAKLNVPFVDNYAVFQERLRYIPRKELFIYDNAHPNANGYKIMAEAIFKVITAQEKFACKTPKTTNS